MENIRIAYVQPDYVENYEYAKWKNLSLDEISQEEGVEIYTTEGFQADFNWDYISDLGYIFFFNEQ